MSDFCYSPMFPVLKDKTEYIKISDNFVNDLYNTKTTGTAAIYGIYDLSSPSNETYNNNKVFNIEIYDISGRLVCNKEYIDDKIDLSKLKSGTYLIKMFQSFLK